MRVIFKHEKGVERGYWEGWAIQGGRAIITPWGAGGLFKKILGLTTKNQLQAQRPVSLQLTGKGFLKKKRGGPQNAVLTAFKKSGPKESQGLYGECPRASNVLPELLGSGRVSDGGVRSSIFSRSAITG